MSTDDKRIREFAYQIWESEGRPDGQEHRHWEMARKLAEAEALAPSKPPRAIRAASAKPGKPATKPKAVAKPAAAAPVVPPGEKVPPGGKSSAAKKPRAPRKPAAS
ncbi:Protein of unknown function [Pseudomonas chlororaphis]|uniref:DUF2934 domain-containing protein n=1 Tax=Pseudomonas chlororaphis TaxID=587753 RepID=UPI00087A3E4C|nr:DUF2934 domain-containing protein [Pseudomonas chlororaphis]AZD54679.1 hypothetical protein C4K19_2892 [Pseudomonas chlororaphis subsp. aurantiaca]AZD60743.1 hypothetical protein C4K18_2770 [Pseudomonas chlororaphis subsp. aurantiaca]AZD66733.1 hypothetical protein C4K17_2847 [Pseudomonas chlororaphis subsp. aurantiaca]QIT22776.1 DUF2934 domain-containing protein [Pseudomonas chlororaphis subsp. aurantiaca]WDH06950.1 DUF2934 domain-containing protein [Pseudomonas chlororaphis]